ncbi:MAG: hypothetical protein MUE32_02870 [Bacteroidales bacterium]|jgi:hypothetical protein|nr:hypothetical protein [Bacteroidales bacterium]
MLTNLFIIFRTHNNTLLYLARSIKTVTALILFLISTSWVSSQEWNSARLTVLYGSSIPFNFNSIEKIRNGIEIITGTQIGISMADSNQVGHDLEGFDLNFRSFNGQANIRGDVYTLPLNRIRVRAENSLGLGAGLSTGYQDLTTGWTTLFSYTNAAWTDLTWQNHQLVISYECGKPVADGGNGSLLGEEPDYYNVEIEFELVPTGPGF